MRKTVVLLGVAALAAMLAAPALAANRGVTFTPIGFIDPPGAFPYSAVTAMNPEGTVFMANPSFLGNYCVEWTRENGWGTQIGSASSTCRIASNGTVMASGVYPTSNPLGFPGSLPSTWPGTWTGTLDAWTQIPPNADYPMGCTGSSSMSFYDMGGNGDYATGLTYVQTTTPTNCSLYNAFRWDRATNTTVALGVPSGSRGTRGNGISDDGNTVVGWGQAVFQGRRGARWDNGTWSWLSDPNGETPKICAQSGGGCTSNSASTTTGCPEFVDDGNCVDRGTCQNIGTCQNRGTCVSNQCVGGTNPGASCTSDSQCRGACLGGSNDGTTCTSNSVCQGTCTGGTNPGALCTSSNACAGTCTGPNAGAVCTSNGACPDTLVCVDNPDWNDRLFKGEAYAVSPDGHYACGRNFGYDFPDGWNAGYRANPDGSFTPIPPPESFQDFVDPYTISANGKTIGGRVGNPFFGAIAFFWTESMGTQDLQLFLVQQGLDELFFWYFGDRSAVFDVSADGKILGGTAVNPDNQFEGFIVDISKVWVCHVPPGHPENARTLGISSDDAADHLAHGDFLGTCEFLNSGGLSRAAELRQRLNQNHNMSVDPDLIPPSNPVDYDLVTGRRNRTAWGAPIERTRRNRRYSPRD
jgi:hypothetical protein